MFCSWVEMRERAKKDDLSDEELKQRKGGGRQKELAEGKLCKMFPELSLLGAEFVS